MTTLQRELRTVFLEILTKYGIQENKALADELASAAKEWRYSKKGDILGGALFFAQRAKERGEDKIEDVLCDLERLLCRKIDRTGQWQDLAKWMLKQETKPYQQWAQHYMSDPFNAKTSWRMTPAQVRASWPQAFKEAAEAGDNMPELLPGQTCTYTAEDNLNLITPERAAELLAKARRKATETSQNDTLYKS